MDQPLVFLAAVLALGIAAQWLAWRLKLPSILLLLAMGFAIGVVCNPAFPEPTITDEVIPVDLLFPAVSLAVAVILFEGGLSLRVRELGDAGGAVLRLITVTVLIAWILTGLAAHFFVGMDARLCVLIGAILVVTGPTVIGPLMRHVRPHRRVGSVVKWEGIVVDPIGAVLAVLVFDSLVVGQAEDVFWVLGKILIVGLVLGVGMALLLVQFLRRYWIPDFLHNAVFLAAAIGAFALSNQLAPEAGLITVTVMGIVLANQKHVTVRHVVEFKENLRVVLISCLFILLAARVRFEDMKQLGWGGVAFVVVLILVIRPLSVMVATVRSELSWNERLFLGFLAPRGIVAAAVTSVFALDMERHVPPIDLPGQERIVPLTFLVIMGTVAFYGLVAAPLARMLNLAARNPQGILFAGGDTWVLSFAKAIQEEGISVLVVDTNFRRVSLARIEGIPSRCASIVSDYMEEIDLGGVGRLLAVTPNDELNSLASMEYASLFGRAQVFQLPFGNVVTERNLASPDIRGRFLFSNEATHSRLSFRHSAGAQVKKTKITETFTFQHFTKRYGDDAIVLGVLDKNRQFLISTADAPLIPKSGQTVFAFVDPVDMSEAEEA